MKKYWGVLILWICNILIINVSLAQTDSSGTETSKPLPKLKSPARKYSPYVGIGTGMLSFYGEVATHRLETPFMGNLGFKFGFSQQLNSFLDLEINALFGTLTGEVHSAKKHLNFKSEIRSGGINVYYNFKQLLPGERLIEPFIMLGVGSFEFHSKSDMFYERRNGQKLRYYYWKNGSIRDVKESTSYAGDGSKTIRRDHKYETDLRSSDLDGLGLYSEKAVVIPIGAGATLNLTDRLKAKLGSSFYITTTDYIDNITEKSINHRRGNNKSDKFLFGYVSVHYALLDPSQLDGAEDDDYYADDTNGDYDGDGVGDFVDSCQLTPLGVEVDSRGCPLDGDGDRVADYLDKEVSPSGAIVNMEGIEWTDTLIHKWHLSYIDSTGEFAEVIRVDHIASGNATRSYTIKLGEFSTGVPAETMNKFLSVGDIQSQTVDSNTIYTVTNYPERNLAEARKNELLAAGFDNAEVIILQNGEYYPIGNEPVLSKVNKDVTTETVSSPWATEKTDEAVTPKTSDIKEIARNEASSGKTSFSTELSQPGVVYRIQLGAYKNKMSEKVFSDVKDVVFISSEQGFTKYLTGSFTNFDEAAKTRVNMIVKGFPGAFIVAYKDGQRITLNDSGVQLVDNQKDTLVDEASQPVSVGLIEYKVQLGVFRNEVPEDLRTQYNAIPKVEQQPTDEGLTRYTTGVFGDYESAVKYKNEIIEKYNIPDSFVIVFFKGKLITVQEATELLRK